MVPEIVCIGGHEAGDLDFDGVRRVLVVEGDQDSILCQGEEFRFGCDCFVMAFLVKGNDRAVKQKVNWREIIWSRFEKNARRAADARLGPSDLSGFLTAQDGG